MDGLDITLVIIYAVMVPFIIVFNVVVIGGMIFCKQLRTPTDQRILSIAVVNLIIGFITIPLRMIFHIAHHSQSRCSEFIDTEYCAILLASQLLPFGISLSSMIDICFHNIFAMWKPNRYLGLRSNTAILDIISIWSFNVLIVGIALFYFKVDTTIGNACEGCWKMEPHFPRWFSYTITIMFFIAVIMIIIDIISIFYLRKCKRNTNIAFDFEKEQSMDPLLVVAIIGTYLFFGGVSYIVSYQITDIAYVKILPVILSITSSFVAPMFAYCRRINRTAFIWMLKTPPWKWNKLDNHFSTVQRNLDLIRVLRSLAETHELFLSEGFAYTDGLNMVIHEAYLLAFNRECRALIRYHDPVFEIDVIIKAIKKKQIQLTLMEASSTISVLETIKLTIIARMGDSYRPSSPKLSSATSSFETVDSILGRIKERKKDLDSGPDAVPFVKGNEPNMSRVFDRRKQFIPFKPAAPSSLDVTPLQSAIQMIPMATSLFGNKTPPGPVSARASTDARSESGAIRDEKDNESVRSSQAPDQQGFLGRFWTSRRPSLNIDSVPSVDSFGTLLENNVSPSKVPSKVKVKTSK